MPKCLLFLFIFYSLSIAAISKAGQDCTDVARDDETLLVFSTLGGGLTAIDPITNEIRWSIEDEPAVKIPIQTEFPLPQYLPDPRDGSLYQMGNMGGIKKMPYTIPQLVANAPCKSSDGILYSGRKSDTWYMIDPKTGQREKVFGFGAPSSNQFKKGANSRGIYLGRTQYTVLMYDSLSNEQGLKPWNVTFFDYSSHTMSPDLSNEYEWLHLAGSASGLIVTLDRRKGTFLWQRDLSSPVIAAFLLGPEGLLSVPFTTVSDETLLNIADYTKNGNKNDIKLFQSLYVGEHFNGLYAIPSLVDKSTATITANSFKLLAGPEIKDQILDENNLIHLENLLKMKNENIILLGYYHMPEIDDQVKMILSPTTTESSSIKDLATIVDFDIPISIDNHEKIIVPVNDQTSGDFIKNSNNGETVKKPTSDFSQQTIESLYANYNDWLDGRENKILKFLLIILIGSIIFMFWYFRSAVIELKQQSQNSSRTDMLNFSQNLTNSTIEMANGEIRIGKICFNSNEILGKGCEGTFVFKGSFEDRSVAVKRLLPECFTLADREVTLLRESDTHENVVRYFCTENDRQFKYIAVELCAATLQDYIEGPKAAELQQGVDSLEVLRQATNGLKHLHTLNIVHRDIKPQNVLLSFPDVNNSVRAMISDFGLCKKLNVGRASFSKRSGITGTEGWIAPEMIKGHRTTTAVDIFSLGCVFYYVLSDGKHVFGEPMKRQANILCNEYDISDFCKANLTSTKVLAEQLIKDMIDKDPSKRPSAQTIQNHPLFWNQERILAFLQDVSDRVEKSNISSEPLRSLEKNAKLIVREDWSIHLDLEITTDLRKYRGYQGNSVRDLLRALRNKKHHYHELTKDVQDMLGAIPNEFTTYWISKFPYLLSHTFHALEICSKETSFQAYYDKFHVFTKPEYFSEDSSEINWRQSFDISPRKIMPGKSVDDNDWRQTTNAKSSPKSTVTYRKKGSYNFRKNGENLVDGKISNRNGYKKNKEKEQNIVWTLNE